jgi:hypothetical protein
MKSAFTTLTLLEPIFSYLTPDFLVDSEERAALLMAFFYLLETLWDSIF